MVMVERTQMDDSMQLLPHIATTLTPILGPQLDAIFLEARAKLRIFDPMLEHITTVKLVRNERRNLLNVRIRKDYLRLLFHITSGDNFFCFFPDYSLQPFVRIVCLHRMRGEIRPIPPELDADLKLVCMPT